jgi:NADH-quinone oxidoreductase subunit G
MMESAAMKIVIDDRPVEVEEGTTILQAAKQAGLHIPHLCFHPAFVPEGSCRICLVEIEGLPKLELACATAVRDGMKISTQSPRVREARRGVLEFLLAEHPLDCPICDKAGECKLQDYYQEYGLFESAFKEAKEKREKINKIGEKLILDRERCILCTRCVRFLSEITKTQELGVFRRGIHSEISIYEGAPVKNNYSGNLVDLCPVGAITDMEFRFKTRTWFLEKSESICPLCSRGCNIYVDYHPGFVRVPGTAKIYRIRARENPDVNGSWICDYGRYGYRSLEKDQADKILWRIEGRDTIMSWEKILSLLAEKLRPRHLAKNISGIAVIANTWMTNEELFLFKKIFKDDLGLKKIFFADPRPGSGDGFLLQAERTPNARAAKEMGLELSSVNLEDLSKNTDILIIFGSFLADLYDRASIKSVLDKIRTKALVSSHRSGLESYVDFILPASGILEKTGSLTNRDGLVQKFSAVCPPCGDSRPEWSVLVELAKELRINAGYYSRLTQPEVILKEMGKEIAFFR